jgi:SAM-dependent methyltransferase
LNRTKLEQSGSPFKISCPVCGSEHLKIFFETLNVPVFCNLLWDSPFDARNCPKGHVKLAFCYECSHITNIAFNPDLLRYTELYENSLDYSTSFQAYTQALAKQLLERYQLHNADIVEIGCGNGSFLSMLCELGNNRGTGFDPAVFKHKLPLTNNANVELIKDYYSERYANYRGDLIVCRQMLEHVFEPRGFLRMLRRVIGNRLNTDIFFEVPNAVNIFQRLFIWDIIYEHYSYFTPVSLSYIFSLSGFRVRELDECFGGQFLCVHASPRDGEVSENFISEQTSQISRIAGYATSFATSYSRMVNLWRTRLERIKAKGQVAVVWGTGSKAVTFLNTMQAHIEYAVDINPQKQGKYVAGTGQKIVSPQYLRSYKPDIIIVMNPIYIREIRALSRKLGLHSKLYSASPI